MTDASELYQAQIIDHDENPRNEGRLEAPTHSAKVSNPLCGDRVQVDLEIDDGVIKKVSFKGRGCALSRASASMMTEILLGRRVDEVPGLSGEVSNWLATDEGPPGELSDLEPLGAVRAFPSRIKCVTLAWEALEKALR